VERFPGQIDNPDITTNAIPPRPISSIDLWTGAGLSENRFLVDRLKPFTDDPDR
jgi:hypothetical protein